jgi:soluble lytic murein transglycosylase-like protein
MTRLLCAIVMIVLPIHLDKCSENNITQQSAPKAATGDATRNEVRLADSMSATYQKCRHIAPKLRPEIIMAAYKWGRIYNVEPELLLAIAYVESSFNPMARSKSSIGLMGINYRVWRKELSLDFDSLYEVDYNMSKGALILRRYINKSGEVWKGVHLYNNGYRGQNTAYVPKVRAMYKKLGGEK